MPAPVSQRPVARQSQVDVNHEASGWLKSWTDGSDKWRQGIQYLREGLTMHKLTVETEPVLVSDPRNSLIPAPLRVIKRTSDRAQTSTVNTHASGEIGREGFQESKHDALGIMNPIVGAGHQIHCSNMHDEGRLQSGNSLLSLFFAHSGENTAFLLTARLNALPSPAGSHLHHDEDPSRFSARKHLRSQSFSTAESSPNFPADLGTSSSPSPKSIALNSRLYRHQPFYKSEMEMRTVPSSRSRSASS
ncbi:hypothetical protein F4778DRAFT_257382 [Xylariomycetidae sp. FL2044]|nr:hypothetical protein F4778DRAFT_257382 [Xylariomycetidae sp. FL2044]